ncbi:flagella basal body P-ring formation protein FlgA [Palleronia marisminoris]|uniref:Flagella basal body P-ring formation protein FlgA n=1 Tax=Palleronia marisminoris TaxID=315423 RepID=A0A1Y5SSJ6_9RHOB|nr:flagellar basal body P-ring formation chaperone FlgA [Palleronia marisminoris]SFG95555.1 flagella basal body P-ring formation protein FlgA [Palleronia marisminoris]SLN47039.1 flagellar basal body P-ring biosynthesis protein FlgA [Palleronia marisminoris]
MIRLALILALVAPPALADIVVATRTIRANSLIGPGDVSATPGEAGGFLSDPAEAVGRESRVTLYAGRPLRAADLGSPALIERNQIVTLNYLTEGLSISADARALDRAGAGDRLRVMNLSSRTTVIGEVAADGSVHVGPGDVQ